MKTIPTNLELTSEIIPTPAPAVRRVGRFQVIIEHVAGVCVSGAFTDSPEEAVEAFMVQAPGCEEGEISLFDREEQRVVASVKWKMETTENGLRVSHRHNMFHDWHLALIALDVHMSAVPPANQASMHFDLQQATGKCHRYTSLRMG